MRRGWRDPASLLTGVGISLALVLVTWLSYYNGGAPSGLIHLYYIPIVIAAYVLGDLGGIVTAFAAALLAAVLPAKVIVGGVQPFTDMVTRGIIFYFVGIMTARMFTKMRERREEASTLAEMSYLVSSSLRINEVLRTIATTAVRITSAKACCIRLLDRDREQLVAAASYGLGLDFLARGPLLLSENPIYRQVVSGRTVAVLDVQADPRFAHQEEAKEAGLVSLLAIPLSRGGEVFGVLGVYSGSRHQWERRERRLLRSFAEHASVAIHNARLHEDLRRSYWETVSALARAIEAKDPYTMGHSERVTDYALQLGRAVDLSPEDMETLRFGATLHDIGRIGVGESAKDAPGHLGMADEMMDRMHPLIGISILQPIEFLAPALVAVRYHHERWDGKGYPEGLEGEAIPLLARIVAVANTYDRLRTGSPGKPGYSVQESAAEMRRLAGSALDPKLTERFLEVVSS